MLSNPEKYVVNLSDITLSHLQLEALSLGFNFSVSPGNCDGIGIEAQFEYLYEQLSCLTPASEDAISWIKAKAVDFANQFYVAQPEKCTMELRRNEDVVILRPDKGSGVVLMSKQEYVQKMHTLLSNEARFIRDLGGRDKTEKVEKSIVRELRKLHK